MSRDNNMPPFGNGGPQGPGGPHQGQGGYPMMPYGGMPIIVREGYQPQQPKIQEPESPPLRVRVALAVMNQLNQKEQLRLAATEQNIEAYDGLKPTPEEQAARTAACDMLSVYFMGKLEPDKWESQQFEQTTPTVEFGCICRGSNEDCPFCQGTGKMELVIKGQKSIPNVQTHEVAPAKSPPQAAPAPLPQPRKRPPNGGQP